MADSMRDIKRRIKSVTSTRQITHAMELVAGAKMMKARQLADSRREYTDYLVDTMHLISGALKNEEQSPYLKPGKGGKDLYIVITSDKGLAGGFNSNLLKFAALEMEKSEKKAVCASGSKGIDFFRRRNYEVLGAYAGNSDEAEFSKAQEIGKAAATLFLNGEIRKVFLIYNRFKSMMTQIPTVIELLPLEKDGLESVEDKIVGDDEIKSEVRVSHFSGIDIKNMLFEPGAAAVIAKLIPYYIENTVYGALLESAAGELASRRMAMESATDNANEIIDSLNLKYNRARQGAITQEITEIISGAEAAK